MNTDFSLAPGLAHALARPARRRAAPADRGRDAGGGRAHRRRLLRRPAQGRPAARRAPAARRRRGGRQRQPDARRPSSSKRAGAGPAERRPRCGFPTMARAPDAQGGASRLVALKAVPPGYPLRGSLQVADAAGRAGRRPRATCPRRGEAWVDAPLLEALGAEDGRPAAAGRRAAAHRARDHGGARPRRRLHELRAARDDQRRPTCRPPGWCSRPAASATASPWPATTRAVARFADWADGGGRRSPRCAACASSRWKAAGPRCARRWTAPRNSSTWWRCWRRC